MFLKFVRRRTTIFDTIKLQTNLNLNNTITESNNEVLKSISLIWLSTFKNNNPKWFKFLLLLVFSLLSFCLYKYNIFTFIINNFNINYLIFIWVKAIIFHIVYNTIGYFTFLIENDIKILLNKIKIKFIKDTIDNFIVLKNSPNINKELMRNYFLKNIYFVLILTLLTFILIIL